VGVKLHQVWKIAGSAIAALCLLLPGCGGKGNAANVITVAVGSSSGPSLILGQSTTLTATVTGATSSDVNWTPVCQFTTTTTDSTGKVNTTKPVNCPQDTSVNPPDDNHTIFGVFSNQQATTEVFTATSTLPDPKTYPGLEIIVTAQSQKDTKKTGTIKLTLNSGINVSFTPSSAGLPINELQSFLAVLTNDTGKTTGVTWSLTQQIPNSTAGSTPNPYTPLASCSPSCGTLDDPNANPVTFTAPPQVPTAINPAQKDNPNSPAKVTLVAVSKADTTRVAVGTITITPGGPISFNNISPSIAPQGATLWDIYLDAPNISSASQILLTYPNSQTPVPKTSASGQIKILFPVPVASTSTSTTPATTCSSTSPCSTGARLRLNASDLNPPDCAAVSPCTVSVSVVDPGEPCNTSAVGTPCTASGVGTFTIQPVRATSTATTPEDIVQGSQTQPFAVTVDGGYFGPGGNNAAVYFQTIGSANQLLVNPNSTSRQLSTSLQPTQINPTNPGLYPLYVRSNGSPAPSPNNPSVTNLALFPDYSSTQPAITSGTTVIPAGTNPSAADIDPTLGVLVVAETGSNTIEFFTIGIGSLTSICTVGNTAGTTTCPGAAPAPINVPTSVSVDRNNHSVAVVNYGTQAAATSSASCAPSGQSVTVLTIPNAPPPLSGPAPAQFTVPLPFDPAASPSGALQNSSVCPAPMPYSIGVDSDSHLALVAYSSQSINSLNNLGFIVNLNPDSSATPNNYGCALDHAINTSSTKVGQCLSAQVTLNTGTYPHIAVEPHSHRALVTPGGSGVVRGVDVTKGSTMNVVASAKLAAGVVTVTIDPKLCPLPLKDPTTTPPIINPCPFSLVPGAPNTVLITGLTAANSSNNNSFFNGVYSVAVTSNTTFTYVVNSTATDNAKGGCQFDQTTGAKTSCATVFYGQPDQIFGLPPSTQGVTINPITQTAAIADANSVGINGPQIDLLSGLDQSVSSISFLFGCTAFSTACQSAAELPATTSVAWQPYTNALVSYNPKQGFVSVSDPAGHKRYAIVPDPVKSPGSRLGPGAAALTVSNGTTNANTLTLWGGVAVDPNTDQAFVVESGAIDSTGVTNPGGIQVISLKGAAPVKSAHISEVIVPGSTPGSSGGVPNALVPQAMLTCTPTATNTCDFPGVQIFGTGFDSATQVLLDSQSLPSGNVQVTSPQQLTVTIPGSLRLMPHHYALTLINGSGVQSNSVDFLVIGQVDLSSACISSGGGATNTQPSSVAIADQIANGPLSPFALVSVTGCNSVVKIDLNPASPTFGQQLGSPITVGTNPEGIAIWQTKGWAVVANNGAGTASLIDLTQSPPSPVMLCAASSGSTTTVACPDVSTGTNPTGVAINEATGAAIVTNTGSNTVTMLNLGLLACSSSTSSNCSTNSTSLPTTIPATSIGGIEQPTAVAIDPDRNQGIAVVTSIQINSGTAPTGSLSVVEIGTATPALSPTTFSSGFVSSIPTGIVFDPAVATTTTNPGVFFANSSGTNAITEFNPDPGGGGTSVSVGINPTSLAINPQTGAMLTANSASNTISIVDTISSPFKTHQTLGIPGSPTFGVAIDQFTNLAVIVDQANMRVLLFPMPN
jgi:DNA-binding beta-propeller fold protein YncE